MKTVSKQLWVPHDIILEDAALEVVKSEVNTLVFAGPGAGKTELLGQRACFLLETNTCPYPKRLLAVSFKKDAASNLSDRVTSRCGKELSYRFESLTFDSFAKEILDRFYLSLPAEYRPSKNYIVDTDYTCIRRAYELAGYQYTAVSPQNPKPQIPSSVMKLLLYGSAEYDFHPTLTFNLISRLANYLLATNILIIKALQSTYSHVFLDEFQDTTSLQYELIQTCFHSSHCTITAVGDQKQRIMSWAGAMPNVFEKYTEDFCAITHTLLMNYRSAPRLITMQCALYNQLKSTKLSIMPCEKWQENDGVIALHIFSTDAEEASFIKAQIKLKLESGTLPKDICILTKRSVDEYCKEIIGPIDDIPIVIRNESIYQDLLKEDLAKILYATLLCSQTQSSAEEFVYIQETLLSINSIEIDDEIKVNTMLVHLFTFITEIGKELQILSSEKTKNKSLFEGIISTIIDYFGGKKLHDFFPQYQNGDYFERVKVQFIDLLWKEFTCQFDWLRALRAFEGETSVPVMTIHKSKGLEFECVFFVGLEDNSFFSFDRQKDEDTCAFFVAISRAKNELNITRVNNRYSLTRNAGVQSIQRIQPLYDAMEQSGVIGIVDHTSI